MGSQNQIIGMIGPKGTGKSYRVAQAWQGMERAAVYNMMHDDPAYLTGATEVVYGNPRELCRLMFLGDDVKRNSYRIVYRPTPDSIGGVPGREEFIDFPIFLDACYERQNMTMIIDEAHVLCSPWTIPEKFKNSFMLGRHPNLDIIWIAHAPQAVHRVMRENTDEAWFWGTAEELALDTIAGWCGEEVAGQVRNLRLLEAKSDGQVIPGQMLRWVKATGLVEVTP